MKREKFHCIHHLILTTLLIANTNVLTSFSRIPANFRLVSAICKITGTNWTTHSIERKSPTI